MGRVKNTLPCKIPGKQPCCRKIFYVPFYREELRLAERIVPDTYKDAASLFRKEPIKFVNDALSQSATQSLAGTCLQSPLAKASLVVDDSQEKMNVGFKWNHI